MRASASLGCVWILSGCSLLFSRKPPAQHEQMTYFDCNSDGAAPAADLTWMALSGMGAISTAKDDPDTARNEKSTGGVVAFTALGVLGLASALYGFDSNARCSNAKEKLQERLLLAEAQCRITPSARARELPANTPPHVGCTKDTDCKGARLCVSGACMDPPQAPAAPPQASDTTTHSFPDALKP